MDLPFGGGFELALCCDIIIASENASFGLPEPLVGAVALGGGLHRLPRQIGLKQAMGLILTSRRVSAAEGLRMGFVNEVVRFADLTPTVDEYCQDILKGAAARCRGFKNGCSARAGRKTHCKRHFNAQPDYPEFEKWKHSADAMEGITGFTGLLKNGNPIGPGNKSWPELF